MDLPNTAQNTNNGAPVTHVTAVPTPVKPGATPWPAEPAGHDTSPRRAADPLDPAPTPRALTVSLVIPAKNEARNLAWVLGEIPDCVDEVVMVDGRSVDATRLMASIHRPDIRFVAQSGTGKGDALRAGFASATGDIVVMIDADGSMSAREIPHFLHFLTHGYDFVKGSRFIAGGGSLDITAFRRTGNWALPQLVNTLYDANLTDLCYGFCAFHRHFLDLLDLTADGFDIEAQMTVHALKAGLRIAEVPSLELPRRSGRSNLHAIRDGNLVLRSVLRDRQRRHRTRSAMTMLHLPYSGRRELATHHG
ncbi:MAG: glycosyltransferase family 2 protein [Oryzihumus sp.]